MAAGVSMQSLSTRACRSTIGFPHMDLGQGRSLPGISAIEVVGIDLKLRPALRRDKHCLNIPKDLIVASRIQSYHWIRILQTGKIISASRFVVGDKLLSCRGGDACRRVSSELLYR
jgi:hypothetical protein